MLAQINTNLPVGAIPGAIDVSPMGATTYTVPIEVVPGTQGIQPNLSIVYNSSGGMGLLGMKWDLVGLSAITRSGQLPYFNGHLTAIQFNNNDRFNLDGNRLCNIEGSAYGAVGTKYALEMEDFSRIVSHGGSLGHPDYFTTYTDGLPTQMHHFATNKHSFYTPRMQEVVKPLGLDLSSSWNKALMPHVGRHPDAYHRFVLDQMTKASNAAGGNQAIFLQLYNNIVVQPVLDNPLMLRKVGWLK
ncbi:MAG: AHH domain-containing protein [Bacteroidales bacterium]|nr:AHH domain-containing protein [Bacteroidales bacterium]